MYSKTILLFILLYFQVLAGQAQDCEKLQVLYNQGVEERQKRNYDKAFEILTQVEQQAREEECHFLLCAAKIDIGVIFADLSNYAESLEYYQQALEISNKYKNLNKYSSIILQNIGNLYSFQELHEEALEYYEKSYLLAKKHDSYYNTAINLADLYMKMGSLDKAMSTLEEIHEKIKVEKSKQQWKITYAEVLHSMGKTQEAQKIAETMYLETKKENNRVCYICVLNLLSQIYADQHKVDKAIDYAKEGIENSHVLGSRIELYNKLAKFYALKGEYKVSFHYKDSVIITKDSLSGINNEQLFQINSIKFEVQEYQNQIKRSQQKQRAERILYFILIGVILFMAFFVFKILRNRAYKQKQKRLIAENDQRIKALQLENERKEFLLLEERAKARQEKLKSKIARKNRMLSTTAIYHSGRNELLEKIISSLTSIASTSPDKAIKDYIKELKEHLKTDSKWEEIATHFEKINPGFLKNLKTKHPQLTKKDIRFLCFLHMGLTERETCTIFNITLDALWKRKQRLIKKMEIEKGGLDDYILNLTHSVG